MSNRDAARKFHFIRMIASGGFGAVWLCKVIHADGFSRLAAVKLLHRRWTENEEIARRMRDEARLLGWLRHRNIVDVVDLTSIDGRAAVVMEYLEAVDFKLVIGEMSEGIELIPPRVALEIMAAAASALDAAYNRPPYPGEKPLRVIHRDIKPSNIMVDESGLVKVLDFGVARAEFEARESETRELQFGSVDYMPPERLFFEPETPASDVYSLAATMFEVLVLEKLGKAKGRPERHARFLADRMSFMRARLPVPGKVASEIEELLTRCLAFDHEARPSAKELQKGARTITRQLTGESLAEWAEDNVPDLLQIANSRPQDPSPLTGQDLTEDSKLFDDTGGRPIPKEQQPPPREAPPAASAPSLSDVQAPRVSHPTIMPFEDDIEDDPFEEDRPTEMEAAPPPAFGAVVEEAEDDFDPDLQATREQRSPLSPMTPPPPDDEADAATVVGAPPPNLHRDPPLPPSPPVPALPSLEPTMDDWDDVPTRIETLAKMAEESPDPELMATAVHTAAGVDHEAATRIEPAPPVTPVPVQVESYPTEDPDATAILGGSTPPPPPEEHDPNATAILPESNSPPPPAPPTPFIDQGPPPPPQPTGPVPRVSQDAPAEKPSKLPWILGGLAGMAMVCGIGCLGVGWFAQDQITAQLAAQGISIPSGPVTEDVAPVDPPPVDVETPSVPDGPAIAFHTDLPDLKKLKVTCTGGSGEGVGSAFVALESSEKCQITAYMNDRSRHSASITDATAGDYQCFVDGQPTCER